MKKTLLLSLLFILSPACVRACPDANGSCETYSITLNGITPEYTELEYISSNGTDNQYIDTDIDFEMTLGFRVSGTFTNISSNSRKMIIANFANDDKIGSSVFNLELVRNNYLRNYVSHEDGDVTHKTDVMDETPLPNNVPISYDVYYDATNHTITNYLEYGGAIRYYDFETVYVPDTKTSSLWLFLDKRSNVSEYGTNSPIAIGITRIYKGDNLVANLVPVRRNSDGVLGFYDTVTNTFKTNGGTGTFNAGPAIGPFPASYLHGIGANVAAIQNGTHMTFGGWCDDAGLTENCTVTKTISASASGNKTYYAKILCDAGFGLTVSGTCEPLCAAGITRLRTSTGLIYNLYANQLTSPAIHIQQNGITCYVNLTPGGATGAINIRNNGTVYHATN